jgi:FkbM family methyltransferase
MKEKVKDFCYSLLDKVLLGRGIKRTVNGFKIVFPTRYYKYYEPDYEKDSFTFIKSTIKSGQTVLDIGGHIGLYAVAFGKLVGPSGKVFSFEPTPITNNILRKTVALNGLESTVTVQNEAISKEEGETVFFISNQNADNSNSLVKYETPKSVHGVKVPLLSIDKFAEKLNRKIDFIKIDVEGVELDAVIGAKETLLRDHPLCILALHPYQIKSKGDSLEQIWDVVTGYNYELLYNGKKIDKDFFCKQTELFDVWLQPLS